MNHRMLGRTGLRVSEIGFGAWGIGKELWRGAEDEESLRALHRAADLGMNFIDTALAYGNGHSERLVGRFLRERREQIVVATKIPPKNSRWPARKGTSLHDVFPPTHIVECTEKSLKNLAVDTIHLQQFHVWLDEWSDLPEWYDTICSLKVQGKIRFVGISVNDHQPGSVLKAAASGKVDTFQVIYNIFDQTPEDSLYPLCRKHDIGVIARVPFDEGGLTGHVTPETTFPERDFRNRYFRGERRLQVFERVERLKTELLTEALTLPELALRFCLHHPAVSTVIPGMRTSAHVESNAAVSDGHQLSQALLSRLRAHKWNKDFYQ